jgi:hypothetical protein
MDQSTFKKCSLLKIYTLYCQDNNTLTISNSTLFSDNQISCNIAYLNNSNILFLSTYLISNNTPILSTSKNNIKFQFIRKKFILNN